MFHFVFTLPWLLVVTRFLWPLPWRVSAKAGVALVLLFAAQYHLFSRLSSGSVFTAEMPRSLVILFNWGFSAILLLALMQVVLDLVTFAPRLVRARPPLIAPAVRYAMAGAALALAAIGVHEAIRVPPLKDVEVRIARLPAAFDGYTLLQLSDLHISPLFPAPWTQAVVAGAGWRVRYPGQPRIFFRRASLDAAFRRPLHAPPGKPPRRHRTARRPAGPRRRDRLVRAAAAQGVALQLSGHAHGGLIVGLDRIFALANAGYVSGLYDVQGMQLYVNNGTALWGGLALPLGKPSELTRITLRRAPG